MAGKLTSPGLAAPDVAFWAVCHIRTDAVPDDLRAKGATRVEIAFRDGERIVAFTNRFPPRGAFYFVVPVDGGSNNTRILVNAAAVASITPAMVTPAGASPG